MRIAPNLTTCKLPPIITSAIHVISVADRNRFLRNCSAGVGTTDLGAFGITIPLL
jgi:hypothetical protein